MKSGRLGCFVMSYFLHVFCQSVEPITASQIIEFIRDGCYFETAPEFELFPPEAATAEIPWKALVVHYQQGKRPVRLELNVDDPLLQAEIEETMENLERWERSLAQLRLKQWLAASQQVMAIACDVEGLSDAAWEMIDCLEAFVAQGWNGIIYAPDDGFYDSQLQLIYRRSQSLSAVS